MAIIIQLSPTKTLWHLFRSVHTISILSSSTLSNGPSIHPYFDKCHSRPGCTSSYLLWPARNVKQFSAMSVSCGLEWCLFILLPAASVLSQDHLTALTLTMPPNSQTWCFLIYWFFFFFFFHISSSHLINDNKLTQFQLLNLHHHTTQIIQMSYK